MRDPGFSLLLAFDSDDAEFVRGFEVGRLWALIDAGDYGPHTIHASNAEMVMRMAEAHGLGARCDILNETFIDVEFTAAEVTA